MDNRMTSVEIQAYSVEEAIRLALEQLGLGRDAVDIEVLSDAGPDEDAEALVRVTAKGMASQPTQSPQGRPARREPGPRRVPGDRPSSRGVPPPQPEFRAPVPREIDPNRIETEDETVAKDVVVDLLSHMGIEADVVAIDNPSLMPVSSDDPPSIYLDILGDDLGMLIGRRGDNLSQLQYMVNLLCNKRIGEWKRVVVDVEGYRGRREESLISLAERVARQVSRGRRPIVLEPMPANERRIIHLTLKQHEDVTTESSGEGIGRRITVLPRD
jgi:spoIIIJ-associated protein